MRRACLAFVVALASLLVPCRSVSGASGPAAHAAEIVFLIDGSGSVSPPSFRLQLDAIRNCVCAPGAPVRLDGSVSVAVVQFSWTGWIEVPPMVLRDEADAGLFCEMVDSLVQRRGSTRALPGLELCEDLFLAAPAGAERSLIALTDTVLFDPSIFSVERICNRMRNADDPVKICGAITDETTPFFQTELFNRLCNTPLSDEFDPTEPVGLLTRVERLDQFQPVCAECVARCVQTGGGDCDGDGVPDDCEPDCNANGVPDDCDLLADPGLDQNTDGVIDACQEDCNANGVADFLDIEIGLSVDCNANAIPDECEGLEDCNENGTPDVCETGDLMWSDCNINGVPDFCETAPFGVVTSRVLALEGEVPPALGTETVYAELTLGTAVDDLGNVWFGSLGSSSGGRGKGAASRGRVFRFELATGAYSLVLSEGDLVDGPEIWVSSQQPGCDPIEAVVERLPSDRPNETDGAGGHGAIRGLTDAGGLLVNIRASVESAPCGTLAAGVGGLLHVRTDRSTSVLYRANREPCLFSLGLPIGPARARDGGAYAQVEAQTDDGSAITWLVSRAGDGGCVAAQSGGAAPDGRTFASPPFVAGQPGPFRVVARGMGRDQTLFYARVTDGGDMLVLDEGGRPRLIAADGMQADGSGIVLAFDSEQGCDIGPFVGDGTDVVFRGTSGGAEAIYLWESESNPDPSTAVFTPIVTEAMIAGLAAIDPVPGSVGFRAPRLGGPCGSCAGGNGVLLFIASWRDAAAEPDTPDERTGLFAYVPGPGTGAGLRPLALPGQRLAAPYEGHAYVASPLMLEGLDADINGSGQAAFWAYVEPVDEMGVAAGPPVTAVVLASIKPGACDLRPSFGELDLTDIGQFVEGFVSGEPTSDQAEPHGVYDLSDIDAFVACFSSGCR